MRDRLENGLQIIVSPTASPLCAAVLWIEAGALDEAPGQEGAAHFLEHMLFKGTDRRGIGAAAAEIEGLGGDLNAFTSHDETAIHAVVEAGAADRALDVLADLVQGSHVPEGEFEREKAVVLEEIRGYDEDPDTVVEETANALLFPGHAYGRPITGTAAAVARLTVADLAAFRARQHGADRAILAIAGGVDPAAIRAQVERLFGRWRPVGPRVTAAVPPIPGGGRVERTGDRFESVAIHLAWRAPACGHADHAAIEVLLAALGDGPSSLLSARLVGDDALATDVWAMPALQLRAGSVSIGFPPRDGKTLQALEASLDAIARALTHGVPARLVERAREAILADMLFEDEGVDGAAHDLAWYTARWGAPEARDRHRIAISAVTPRQVTEAARAWLDPARVTAVVLDRRANPKRLARAVTRDPVRIPAARDAVCHVHESGVVVWILPDASSVCAVHSTSIGGGLYENAKNCGISEAWARCVAVGAADMDASTYGEAMDDVAGGISAWAGRSSQGLRATFPAHHAAEGLDLWAAALVKPRFDEQDLERACDELRDDLRALGDHPDEIGDIAMWEGLFPGHPWALSPLGTTRSLAGLKPGALHKLHGSIVTAANTVIAVAGGVDADVVIEALEPFLADLPRGTRHGVPIPSPDPLKPCTIARRGGRGAAYVAIGLRGPGVGDEDAVAMSVAAALMDGQGGRLFLDLRERRGLAYDVWCDAWSGHGGGSVQFGVSVDPARAREAAIALSGAVDDLIARPPSPEEVERYTRMLAGRHALAIERAAARAGDCAENVQIGRQWGLAAHRARLLAVDDAAVARVIARWITGARVDVLVEPAS